MATNFDFLRKTDKNLYEIISEAENYIVMNILNNAWDRQEDLPKMSVKMFLAENEQQKIPSIRCLQPLKIVLKDQNRKKNLLKIYTS